MKIIKDVDPDFLSKLDRTKNIIMCVHPHEVNNILESEGLPDSFSISLPTDLNLSASNIITISNSALAATFRPKLKISYPTGLKILFSEFKEDPKEDIFWKIYKSYKLNNVLAEDDIADHHIVTDMVFVMYMDTIRMREAGVQMLVKKDTKVIDFYFTWYVQTKRDMPQIEGIYLISDEQVYEDFLNII